MAAAARRRRAIIRDIYARAAAICSRELSRAISRAGGKQWNRPARRAAWRGEKNRARGGGLRLEPAPAFNQQQRTGGEYFTLSAELRLVLRRAASMR